MKYKYKITRLVDKCVREFMECVANGVVTERDTRKYLIKKLEDLLATVDKPEIIEETTEYSKNQIAWIKKMRNKPDKNKGGVIHNGSQTVALGTAGVHLKDCKHDNLSDCEMGVFCNKCGKKMEDSKLVDGGTMNARIEQAIAEDSKLTSDSKPIKEIEEIKFPELNPPDNDTVAWMFKGYGEKINQIIKTINLLIKN